MDLGELWRERRWHHLWLVLVRLPRHSLTKEALAQDEEFVARMLEGADSDDDSEMTKAIRQSEFTPEVEAIYQLIDRTGDVVAAISRLGGGKLRVPPMKRPQTAFDRVKTRMRQAAHHRLVARVLPGDRGRVKGFPAS